MQPKILMIDIETAPSIAYIWKLWQEVSSMNMVAEDWYILCWCAKWVGDPTIIQSALPDHSLYLKQPANDLEIMRDLYPLLDEADIVVGHGCAQFDIKKINTRFITHNMHPPSPYKVVDTLKIARRYFAFMSNKLNDLGKFLDLGEKEETGGFKLWSDCLAGKKSAWKKMVSYCAQDVRLLERVYHALVPYASGMPNLALYIDDNVCPKCGSMNIMKRGFAYTDVSKFQRWVCKDCGSWSRDRTRVKSTNDMLANL
jgi:hypothetical protein